MTTLESPSSVTPRSGLHSISLPIGAVWALWIVGFAVLSAMAPRDIGFDVVHYQIINGWSAFHGRLGHDLAPAEMHSFINPAYNVVVWWLIETLPGPAVAFILGAVQSLGLIALYYLVRNVMAAQGMSVDTRLVVLVAVIGFLATPTISLFASIRNDHIGATAFIAALSLIIRSDGSPPRAWQIALAALMVGAAAGLKLTHVVYVAGFAAAVIAILPGWTARARGAAICALTGAVGFFALAGPWMWVLFREFGNPVYPMFGDFFPAALNPDDAARDVRYLPQTFLAAIVHPLLGSLDGMRINEWPTRDLRLALCYLSALAILSAALFGKSTNDPRRRPARALVVLALGSLALVATWTALFSIQRYGMAAYQTGPLMAVMLAWLWRIDRVPADRLRVITIAGAAGLIMTTQYAPDRRGGWTNATEAYLEIERPAGQNYDDALIMLGASFPSAMIGTAFPEARLTHVGAQPWSRPFLDKYRPRITAAINAHDGPIYLVSLVRPAGPEAALQGGAAGIYDASFLMPTVRADHGLERTPEPCARLVTNFDTPMSYWEICALAPSAD